MLVGNPEEKIPLRCPRRRWEKNMNFQKVRYGSMDTIELDQDRYRWRVLVNVVMNLRVT
jgi:hypothetical protein